MRTAGLIILMLMVFWVANALEMAYGIHWDWDNVKAAFLLSLTFGTVTAIPIIAYAFAADFVAGRLGLPWSALVYVVLVVGGCALLAATLFYGKGMPPPKPDAGWYYYAQGYLPLLAMACVLLVRRLA
jgi:predicted membrane channel-forming protein YqfA (hemolysin III family)